MIEIVQGDDRTITYTFETASGVAYNLTSCTLFVTVKRSYDDADAAAVISGTLTISTPATSGIATWSLVPADTKNLLGLYKFDIQLKTAAGLIQTVLSDEIQISPEVTIRVA